MIDEEPVEVPKVDLGTMPPRPNADHRGAALHPDAEDASDCVLIATLLYCSHLPWTVCLHPAAIDELSQIPARERVAILNAVQKLEQIGPTLGYPHSSNVEGADNLRELRPRRGDSPWRAFYRRIADDLVVGAIGPEANVNNRAFKQAVKVAEARIDELEAS